MSALHPVSAGKFRDLSHEFDEDTIPCGTKADKAPVLELLTAFPARARSTEAR